MIRPDSARLASPARPPKRMKSRIRLRSQVARVGACLALLNFAVPGGALVSFGVPAKEAVEKALAARAAAAKDLATRKKKSASRLLTEREERTMQGRDGENPYCAGQGKEDVVYKGVDLMTDNYATSATDMGFDGGYGIPVNVTRSYSANAVDEGPFGKGWTLSADVRSTAGGLLKSGSAPVRSIPTVLQERNDAETDPNVVVQPVQAVTAVDAGGTAETVAKDVDGILTTPPWDNNTYDSVYQWVTLNGQSYQVLVSNTVKTLDGTVYTYVQEGSYPSGTVPFNNPNATPQAANVLKVTSATDRQGNVTTYSYGSGTVSFQKADGTTVEHPLVQVSMPGGHVITLTWGTNSGVASYQRLTSVSDGPGGRTVTYGYTGQPGHGLLASVTTPGGKTTSYGYGSADRTSGTGTPSVSTSNLLTTITDPRGLTTTIHSMAIGGFSNGARGYLPLCIGTWRIDAPNGTTTRFYTSKNGYKVDSSGADLSYGEGYAYDILPGDPYGYQAPPLGSPYLLNLVEILYSVNAPVPQWVQTDSKKFFGGTYYNTQVKVDSYDSMENLITSVTGVGGAPVDSLAAGRGMNGPNGPAPTCVATETTYNFAGNPLNKDVRYESGYATNYPAQTTQTSHQLFQYAYWGGDKYFQQKATQDQAGRFSLTDYYPSTAPAGKRGQTYRVYDPKNGGITLNTGVMLPIYATSATAWRYQVTPTTGQYSAQFDYDAQGRSIDVWKLQSATSSPWTYVRTHTSYGGDGSPGWGQASQVVEDYGGIGRTTTTQAYTSWGKACDVIDAAGHEFVTSFDPDGLVQSVTRTDGGLNQTIVSYAYGSSGVSTGQPTSVTDGLSGVAQTIAYTQSGGGVGQPASVAETNGSDSYAVSYAYSAAGDRQTATYATPSSTRTWDYEDYESVGLPTSAARAFRTLRRLDASGNPTGEELHYSYDVYGRLLETAFAQSPYVDSNGNPYVPSTAGAPYYDASHPASRRARASYAYDAGGRLTSVSTNWDAFPNGGGAATTTGLAQNVCGYELGTGLNRGLKTSSAFTIQNVAGNGYDTRTEVYGYDPQLDYLTSANYGDGLPSATPAWSYDAAGNRNDAAVDNLNRATSLSGVAMTSDIAGNRRSMNGVTYGWDVINRLTSLSGSVTAAYQYRSDGMRVGKQTGGVSTLVRYDGQMGIEDVETSAAGTTVTRYGLGSRGVDMIERVNGSSTVTGFPIYDAHGSNVATLTRNGNSYAISDRRTYDAWGVIRSQQSAGDPKLRYCASLGHKADDESGLIYMRARYYEPANGRFVSQDPAGSGSNWFVYCSDNPVGRADRSGKNDYSDSALAGALMYCWTYVDAGYPNAALMYGIEQAEPLQDGFMKHGIDLIAIAFAHFDIKDPEQISEIKAAYDDTLGSYLKGLGDQKDLLKETPSYVAPALDGLAAYYGACEGELFMQDVDGILSP